MKKITIILAFIIVSISACKKEEDKVKSLPMQGNDKIKIQNDKLSLQSRVKYYPEFYVPLYNVPESQSINKNKKSPKDNNFVLMLRAEVEPLEYNGFKLRATHVDIKDNKAYVSYNVEGNNYLGGIEIYDVTNPKLPVLLSQAIYTDADINASSINGNNLYLAAAKNVDLNTNLKSPATLEKMKLENGLLSTNNTTIDLPSYSSTDVSYLDNKVYVTNGDNGGLSVVNDDSSNTTKNFQLTDARSTAIVGNNIAVMQGQPAKINIFDKASQSFTNSFVVGGANIAGSKTTIEYYNNRIYVATGDEGLKILDANTGIIVDNLPRPITPSGGDPADYVTNGVTVNHTPNYDLVLVANGGAGVYVYRLIDNQMLVLGSMDFGSSTNFVKGKDNLVFVATGTGGFKILEIVTYTPGDPNVINLCDSPQYSQLPPCVQIQDVCNDLPQIVNFNLPESVNAINTYPQYFDVNNKTNIVTKEKAEVYVSFINEGAGYKNSLGYYYYPVGNPPTSVSEILKTIIFPNASASGSGGSLIQGHTMKLTHNGQSQFPANTVIGFFLIANGWSGNTVTSGLYTHFTDKQFNIDGKQQHILLHAEQKCNSVIIGFEDIAITKGGDKDFNDIIFQVSTIPGSALNTDGIYKIY